MAKIDSLFATKFYRAELPTRTARVMNWELDSTCRSIAEDDLAGQRWCTKNSYRGYTSYASLNDLAWRASIFADLQKIIDGHVKSFAKALAFDLKDQKLKLDSLWINILSEGGTHSGHIHPHSVISGTYYVTVPKRSAALRLEDPRLGLMMAAPQRTAKAPPDLQSFVYIAPKSGTLLLWESWLRHEVPMHVPEDERISLSFNYSLA
jgi:uncharacterized protein (TIGR02466 family)